MKPAFGMDLDVAARIAATRADERKTAVSSLSEIELAALTMPPVVTRQTLASLTDDVSGLLRRARPLLRREVTEDEPVALADNVEIEATEQLQRLLQPAPAARDAPDKTLSSERIVLEAAAQLQRSERTLADVASALGRRIGDAPGAKPPVLARWAELARDLASGPEHVAEQVIAQVRAACESGAPGSVLDLIEAAETLGEVVGEPIATAARIARHRVTLEYRNQPERSHLERFVPRPRALAAFDAVMAPEGPWALHYVGVGGVGKTSLIRHLTLDLARARGLTVARVDFDYLSPDYPSKDPGALVAEIVRELSMSIDSALQDKLGLDVLHQLLVLKQTAPRVTADHPLAAISWSEFEALLGYVGSFLANIPHPVIVLDTCEELTKLDPVGGVIPSVEATFRLIEELHRRAPALRVIFAGRRLLCRAGAGWQASGAPDGVALSAERSYLALHELRGFDRAEAEAAIAKILPPERLTDRELIEALCAASPETGRVNWLVDDGDHAPHYSPFELSLNAQWVRADAQVNAATIRRGDLDPYIEQRIVNRMGELRRLLPAIAILRRFDLTTFAEIEDRPVGEVQPIFEMLAGHEWMRPRQEPGRGPLLEASAEIVARLERWLRKADREAWAAAQAAISERVGPRVRERGLLGVPRDVVDAVFRALPELEAVEWWLELEGRLGDGWAALIELTGDLMSERGAASGEASLLDAAVRASRASAMIHVQPEVDIGAQWELVGAIADRLTARGINQRAARAAWILSRRARLGVTAADARASRQSAPEAVAAIIEESLRFERAREIETSIIAAVEAIVEHAERGDPDVMLHVLYPAVGKLAPSTGGLDAFVRLLRARMELLGVSDPRDSLVSTGRAPVWHQLIERGLEMAGDGLATDAFMEVSDWKVPDTTLDWKPPALMKARAALELIRLGFWSRILPPVWSELHLVFTLLAGGGDDTLHLVAAFRARRACSAVAGPNVDERKLAAPLIAADPPVHHAAHARFSIGAAVVALVRDGVVHPDEVAPCHATRARLAWARRYRDRGALRDLRVAPDTTDLASLVEHECARAVVTGRSLGPSGFDLGGSPIAHWSYQVALQQDALEALVDKLRPRLRDLQVAADAGPLLERARAAAVLEELIELSRYTPAPIVAEAPDILERITTVHPDRLEDVTRLRLRALAAGREQTRLRDLSDVAPRRCAELALEEAELLGLRFPERAAQLYALAATYFERCGDSAGHTAARLGLAAVDVQLHGKLDDEPRAFVTRTTQAPAGPGGVAQALAAFASQVLDATRQTPRRAGVVDASIARVSRGPRGAPPRLALVRSWFARHGEGLAIGLIGFVILTALVGGLLWLAFSVLSPLIARLGGAFDRFSHWLGITTLISMIYGAVKLLTFPGQLATQWRQLLASRIRPVFTIIAADATTATISLATREDVASSANLAIPSGGAWPEACPGDSELPGYVALERHLARFKFRVRINAELLVSPVLQRHAWELAIARSSPRIRELVGLYRTVVGPDGPGERSDASHPFLFHGPPALASAWTVTPAGVVHAIGRPVRELDAMRLDVGRGARSSKGSAALSTSELVPAQGSLVILQGDPAGAGELPTEASRLDNARLRELAVALVEQGAGPVLVIPTVPTASARTLIGDLTRLLEHQPHRDLEVALALATAVRAQLWALEDEAHQAASLEVTLFVPESNER